MVQQSEPVPLQISSPIYIPPAPRRARDVIPTLEARSAESVDPRPSDVVSEQHSLHEEGNRTSAAPSPSPSSSSLNTNTFQENWAISVSRVWGIGFHQVTMEQTLRFVDCIVRVRKPTYIVTANLNYAMLCHHSSRLREFTERAGLVLCDGMPILWRSRWNRDRLPERVAGADLIYRLAEQSQAKGHRIYLYGAAEGVAEKTAAELKRLYPGCVIAGYQCPPFRAPSESELKAQIDSIRQAKPDILLVALGQPKGEFWIEDYLQALQVPLCIQLGASFDFVAGTAKRAPKFFQRTGLEWLYRTMTDPKRLVPRYLKNAMFLLRAIRNDLLAVLDNAK